MSDGSGYPDGLSGDTIPLGARILAVADAYDAMQRPVPFREPLSARDAVSEVVRVKGIQFDPAAVDAFIRVVAKQGVWSGALKDRVRMPAKKSDETQMSMNEPNQPTLEEAAPEAGQMEAGMTPEGATPGDGTSYELVRDEIEKDIRDWERADSGARRRAREQKKRAGSRKKKDEERTDPEAS
jgi:hypothetical protein